MRKIISYQIISGNDSGELETLVNSAISAGWAPVGGVSYSSYDSEDRYVQAVVKYEYETSKKPCHNYTE